MARSLVMGGGANVALRRGLLLAALGIQSLGDTLSRSPLVHSGGKRGSYADFLLSPLDHPSPRAQDFQSIGL